MPKVKARALITAFPVFYTAGVSALQGFFAAKKIDSPGGADITEAEAREILFEALTKAATKVKKRTGIDLVPVFASFSDSAEALITLKAEFTAFKKQAKLAESKAEVALSDARAEVEALKTAAVALTKPAVDAVIDAAKKPRRKKASK